MVKMVKRLSFATLIVALAVLAVLPIMQFLSLGYLLEAGGRVARTGRLREGFIGKTSWTPSPTSQSDAGDC